jgi:transcription antitermination factor NusG
MPRGGLQAEKHSISGLAVTVRRPLAILKRGPRAPRIGDRVQVVFGPFAGHSGLCTKVSRQQVGVLLLMFKAQRQVRLSRDAVELI